MLDLLIAIPPIAHETTMTSGGVITFWVIVGVIVALVLVTAIILAIAEKRSVQRQPQMKEAERHYKTSPEERKILLPR